MKKIFVLSFASLASLFPLVSACGPEHGEEHLIGNGFMGFGFFGGIISTLIIVVLVLGVMLVWRKDGK